MWRKRPFYRRMLGSYFLVGALPVLLLCVLIYQIGVIQLRAETIESQHTLLRQTSRWISAQMRDASEMATSISMDEDILSLSKRLDTVEIMEGIDLLSKYLRGNSFFDNIAVRHGAEPILFTPFGTVDESVLFARRYGFSAEELEQLAQLLLDGQSHLAHFSAAGVILNICPLPVFSKKPTGKALFVITRQSILRLFEGADNGLPSVIYLLDAQGVPIFSLGGQAAELLPSLIDAQSSPDSVWRHGGETYHLIAESVEETQWMFVSLLPESELRARMHGAYLILWVVAVVLMAMAAVFWMANRQYRPIDQLHRLASEGQEALADNELDRISDKLRSSQKLEDQLREQRAALQDNLLLRLLMGDTSQELMDALSFLGKFTQAFQYAVLAMPHLAEAPFAQDAHAQTLPEGVKAHWLCMEDQAVALWLLLLPSQEPEPALEAALAAFSNTAQEGMGLSELHPLTELPVAYLEARVALAAHDGGDKLIRSFSDTQYVPQMDKDFQKAEILYAFSLREPNRDVALALLDELLTAIRMKNAASSIQRYYRFRLAELAMQTVLAAGYDEEAYPQLSRLFTAMLSQGSMEGFSQSMRELTALICTAIAARKSAQKEAKAQEVTGWIDANLCDPLLSMDSLADAMGFSVPYWSRFFKEKLDTTFNEYVWQKRSALVKRQLMETDIPLKQIVLDVGYEDASSFIRRFKREEGVTPGQYREMHGMGKG